MATIKRTNIAPLNDQLTVTISKADYLTTYETSLKKHAKTANIPGFRKGMVPAGMIKKMYGQSVFREVILKSVENEMNQYIAKEQIDIFAQPLPMATAFADMDHNHPTDYDFSFEIGLKPSFEVKLKEMHVKRYKIQVTDELVQTEVERLQIRNGNMTEPELSTSEDNVLNVTFIESDKDGHEIESGIKKDNSLLIKYFNEKQRKEFIGKKNEDTVVIQLNQAFDDKELDIILNDLALTKADAEKYFKLVITKVGLVEKAPLDETLFTVTYPNQAITNEAEFRAAVKQDIEGYYDQQAKNQVHDQIYHGLLEQTKMDFPVAFLKRWLQKGGDKQKTEEAAEKEYPVFQDQLKWTVISTQLIADYKVEVVAEDLKQFAKQQLMGYMGGQLGALGDQDQWFEDYAARMMQDRKFVEDSYHRISTDKLFRALEAEVTAKEEPIAAEKFADLLNNHKH